MDAYSQVPPPVPPPLPKKEDNFGKYALIAGGGCFLLLLFAGAVGFFIYYVFQKTGDPLKVVNEQLTAVRENNLEKAYSYCSNGFKQITNYENFQNFVNGNPHLKNSKEFTSSDRSIEQGTAKLKGKLVSSEGSTLPAEYHLVKEGRAWKVQFIDLGTSGVTQNEGAPPHSTGEEYQGLPGEEAREVNPLDNLLKDAPAANNLRFQDVAVEKQQQGDLTVITIRFKVYGFDPGPNKNRMHLVQDLQTYGPTGNLLPELSKDSIKVMDEQGEYSYADLWNSLSIPSSYPRGKYEARLIVHDKISGLDSTATAEFEL